MTFLADHPPAPADQSRPPRLLSADAILPTDPALPPVLHNAGVVINGGRIIAIGERSDLRRQFGELPLLREHLVGLLVPGLINAHTHLELSHLSAESLRQNQNPPRFTRWVAQLMANRPAPDQLEAITRASLLKGLVESLHAGVTTLGDISRNVAITRSELVAHAQRSGFKMPRVVSFGEVVALGKMRHRLAATLEAAAAPLPTPAAEPDHPFTLSPHHLVAGISPHAPYTVEGPALRAAVRTAIVKNLPVAMHLAELSEEREFLATLSGALGKDWDIMRDILDDQIPTYAGGPIRWAQLHGLLLADRRDFPPSTQRRLAVLLAHVNYCDNAELAQLAASSASVAYCPRTHAYFGHAPHRYRDMLASTVNVCLGTDSRASNPDLNVLKEAQLLHQRDQFSALSALEMITRRPAQALGLATDVGSLAPNKFADLAAFRLDILLTASAEQLAAELLNSAPAPAAVYIAGQAVVPI